MKVVIEVKRQHLVWRIVMTRISHQMIILFSSNNITLLLVQYIFMFVPAMRSQGGEIDRERPPASGQLAGLDLA
jgi:hypothetical protein